MITLILATDTNTGLVGSFLSSRMTATIEQAQEWFAEFTAGFVESSGFPDWTFYGLTFANRTLDELRREFPHLFGDGEWGCDCNREDAP